MFVNGDKSYDYLAPFVLACFAMQRANLPETAKPPAGLQQYIRAALKNGRSVTPEEILAALNHGAEFGKRRLREARQKLKPNEIAPLEQYAEATRELKTYLCALVEEWLDTGRREDGSEYPWERDLTKTDFALQRWCAYLWEYPPIPRGGKGHLQWMTVRVRPVEHQDFPIAAATGEAQRLFTALMLADWQSSICKCRYEHCGKYFWIETPQQTGYKHGTCERNCGQSMAAKAKTDRKRENYTARCIAEARKAYARHSLKHAGRDLKEKIKTAVNERLPSGEKWIAMNWVTHHWDAITKVGE